MKLLIKGRFLNAKETEAFLDNQGWEKTQDTELQPGWKNPAFGKDWVTTPVAVALSLSQKIEDLAKENKALRAKLKERK